MNKVRHLVRNDRFKIVRILLNNFSMHADGIVGVIALGKVYHMPNQLNAQSCNRVEGRNVGKE